MRTEGTATEAREARLGEERAWSTAARRGDRLMCIRGALWVTQEGDSHDYSLRSGQAFTADRDGLLVAQAIGGEGALLEFCSSRPAANAAGARTGSAHRRELTHP